MIMQTRSKNIIFRVSQALIITVVIATGMPVKANEMHWELHEYPTEAKARVAVNAGLSMSGVGAIHE